jgi:hypothetical protein
MQGVGRIVHQPVLPCDPNEVKAWGYDLPDGAIAAVTSPC